MHLQHLIEFILGNFELLVKDRPGPGKHRGTQRWYNMLDPMRRDVFRVELGDGDRRETFKYLGKALLCLVDGAGNISIVGGPPSDTLDDSSGREDQAVVLDVDHDVGLPEEVSPQDWLSNSGNPERMTSLEASQVESDRLGSKGVDERAICSS